MVNYSIIIYTIVYNPSIDMHNNDVLNRLSINKDPDKQYIIKNIINIAIIINDVIINAFSFILFNLKCLIVYLILCVH